MPADPSKVHSSPPCHFAGRLGGRIPGVSGSGRAQGWRGEATTSPAPVRTELFSLGHEWLIPAEPSVLITPLPSPLAQTGVSVWIWSPWMLPRTSSGLCRSLAEPSPVAGGPGGSLPAHPPNLAAIRAGSNQHQPQMGNAAPNGKRSPFSSCSAGRKTEPRFCLGCSQGCLPGNSSWARNAALPDGCDFPTQIQRKMDQLLISSRGTRCRFIRIFPFSRSA